MSKKQRKEKKRQEKKKSMKLRANKADSAEVVSARKSFGKVQLLVFLVIALAGALLIILNV